MRFKMLDISAFSLCCVVLLIPNFTVDLVRPQVIEGCPLYGCTPGGSFSLQLSIPSVNPGVTWETDTFLEISPQPALGCVGNMASIVCPINSPRPVGYAGYNPNGGTPTWLDKVLQSPSLPIMDVFGDIIGSDGYKLLKYNSSGGLLKPVIDLIPPLKSIFSINLADNGILLMTSAYGTLTTYFTNGVPGGNMDLKFTVQNETGTFLPISSPVFKGHRTYILTEFQPSNNANKLKGFHRLLAVDINDQFVGKLIVVWYMDLDLDQYQGNMKTSRSVSTSNSIRNIQQTSGSKGCVLVSGEDVFVTLSDGVRPSKPDFWLIKDQGQNGSMLSSNNFAIDDFSMLDSVSFKQRPLQQSFKSFRKKDVGVIQYFETMGFFRSDKVWPRSGGRFSMNSESKIVWGSRKSQGVILGLNNTGGSVKIATQIKLSVLLKAPAEITSKIMSIQNKSDMSTNLVFGVKIMNVTEGFLVLKNEYKSLSDNLNYVLAVDASKNALLWMVAVPGDVQVKGQLLGIPSSSSKVNSVFSGVRNDIIVAYAMLENSTKVFAISDLD